MTETEKMFAGKIYDPFAEGMTEARRRCHELCQKYNALPESDEAGREALLREIMPEHDEGVYLQGPIQFDFGTHIKMGKNSYANFNWVVLDENTVTIGKDVFIGPNCSMMTAIHPLRYQDRNTLRERCLPIVVEDNCWIGSDVTILPGVTIGTGSVIGAGSVVTKDIPANVIAFGNPCKVIRQITEEDAVLPEYES